MLKTVSIIYGLGEGGYHGRKLRKALKAAGYQLTRNPKSADVIIAHSGGCYLLPKDTKAKVVLDIDYTLWPGRSIPKSLAHNLVYDLRTHGMERWLIRGYINYLYLFKVHHTLRLAKGWPSRGSYLTKLKKGKHVFIRNRYDHYCEPQTLLVKTSSKHRYISLEGAHNHIWDNPKPYVELLQSLI
jgi:hypothetical protein